MKKGHKRKKYNKYGKRRAPVGKIIAMICACIIVLCAAAAAFFYFYWLPKQSQEDDYVVYESMTGASLPTISLLYNGYEINTLHGYTQEMDINYIRSSIYVLEDDYSIPVLCELYDNEISEITFEVYNIGGDNLIQNGTVSDTETAEGVLSFDVVIDNIIDEGTEYILVLQMETAEGTQIRYYFRFKKETSSLLSQLEGVLEYNSKLCYISDDDAMSYVSNYMETDYTADDNTDFGSVTLVSSIYSMMWNQMDVEMYGDVSVQILDSDGDIGYFLLTYMLTRSDGDVDEYYSVSEYYRVRMLDDVFRILDYERETDQIFEPSTETISTSTALVGIVSDSDIEMLCNQEGTLSCFVRNGNLWAMDTDNKEIKLIFSFSEGLDDERGNYDQYGIKIVDVTDDGAIQFLVYGYMNAGLHEGKVGIGIYTYDPEEDTVTEDAFIPTELTFSILDQTIGSLVYLSGDGTLYLIIDESLYSLDLENYEAECIVTGLTSDNCTIQPAGRIIAWHEGGSVNEAESIEVLDMETGETYEITADSGCAVKALGFLDEDLVYGQGTLGEIYTEQSGTEYLLMTDMFIIDSDGGIQSENNSGDAFYISAESEYNRIIINQVIEEEDGYAETETFTVFATDLDEYLEMKVTSDYIDIKRTVYYVKFADSTTSAGELTVSESTQVLFTEANTIDINDMIAAEGKYYVYAKGEVKLITSSPAEAVDLAYNETGVVVTDTGELFYKRTLVASTSELTDVGFAAALEDIEAGNLLDMSGITLVEAIYFINMKMPLVWEYEGVQYLIMGFDYESTLMLYDIETGEESTFSYSDAEDVFAETSCWLVE